MQSLKKNFTYAMLAQAASMLISTFIVLLVPKVIGVKGYGQLQYFLLISGYVSLLSFGINDGMYLRNGGKDFSDFEQEGTCRGVLAVVAALSLVECTAILCIAPALSRDVDRAFVFGCFAFFVPLFMLNNYLGCIFQASGRIKDYSIAAVLEKLCCLLVSLSLIVLGVADFRPYVCSYLLGKAAALVYSAAKCRTVIFGVMAPFDAVRKALSKDMPAGIRLSLSTLAAQMVLGVGRFFVDGSFGVEAFGQVSLAISMMNFFLVFINQAGLVLFPTLRRYDDDRLSLAYGSICGAIKVILPVILLAYVPVAYAISWWLPSYALATFYLGILLPICYFDGKNSMIYTTFLKVRRWEASLMRANVMSLVLSAALFAFFSLVVRSISGVAISMLAVVIFRNSALSVACDKAMGLSGFNWQAEELALSVCFVASNLLLDAPYAIGVVALAALAYFAVQRHEMLSSLEAILHIQTKKEESN